MSVQRAVSERRLKMEVVEKLAALDESERHLRRALDRWPAHPMLWFVKYKHLLYSGRSQSAAAFVMDPETLPSGFGPEVQPALALAKAIAERDPADVEAAIQAQTALALSDVNAIGDVVPNLALLGRLDLAFAALDRYLLNSGPFGRSAPIGPMTRRYTDILFTSPMAPARRDPRFASLMVRVGLEDFWRRSGTVPDFRRN